jgi:hypothetical protein
MKNPFRRLSFSAFLAILLAPLARAQVITGQVRSVGGAAVPGVNIDGFDSSGCEIDLANDGTDANGNFTTTVLSGPGVYTFVFYPPPPPLTSHLVAQRANVVVVTTTNLGTITLAAGVLLCGRTVRTGNLPVPDVTLTVIDGLSGAVVLQDDDKTDAFGQFDLAVPAHAIELQIDTTSSAFVLGSKALELAPSADTALGDVFLPPGALVTGQVQRAGGLPVEGADLDFVRVSNGNSVFVPDDNTDATGNFAVVVATGTYDVEICPEKDDLLVTKVLPGVTISTTLGLGTITLASGVELHGTVLTANGLPAAGVDVEVFHAVTGVEQPLCGDDTNAAGAYSVIVPTGTWDVLFVRPAARPPIGADLHASVVVSGPTLLNGTLPPNGSGNFFGGPLQSGGSIVPLSSGKTRGAPGGHPSLFTGLPAETAVTGLAERGWAWLLAGPSPAALRPATAGSARILVLGAGTEALESLAGRAFLRPATFDERRGVVLGPLLFYAP